MADNLPRRTRIEAECFSEAECLGGDGNMNSGKKLIHKLHPLTVTRFGTDDEERSADGFQQLLRFGDDRVRAPDHRQ